jgi:hypothetical protein
MSSKEIRGENYRWVTHPIKKYDSTMRRRNALAPAERLGVGGTPWRRRSTCSIMRRLHDRRRRQALTRGAI